MQVMAEVPWDYFLFEDDGRLYLDVLVEHGSISFSVTTELSAEQVDDYARDGLSSLSGLIGDMRHKALMRQWHAPALPPDWAERSSVAVHEWQRRGKG